MNKEGSPIYRNSQRLQTSPATKVSPPRLRRNRRRLLFLCLQGLEEESMLWSHIPKRAIVSAASTIPQNDIGSYLGLYIRTPTVPQEILGVRSRDVGLLQPAGVITYHLGLYLHHPILPIKCRHHARSAPVSILESSVDGGSQGSLSKK